MIKVGISGTHGTGKTTLAFELAHRLKRENPEKEVTVIYEVARKQPFFGEINEQTTERSQGWIFHRQIIEEMEAERFADIIVCDRTVFDCLAYSQWAGFFDLVNSCLPEALRWIKTYNFIIYLEPHGVYHPIHDGFRSTDKEFQMEIDGILRSFYRRFQIPLISYDEFLKRNFSGGDVHFKPLYLEVVR